MKRIYSVFRFIIRIIPLQKIILFESNPDVSDNTKPVFDELIKKGINKKYKMVWLLHGCVKNHEKIHNVHYIEMNRHRFYLFYLKNVSKVIISGNEFIGTNRKGQLVFYLMHGSPIKDTSSFYKCPSYVSYLITASDYMNEKSSVAMGIELEKCVPLGYPRNDVLSHIQIDLSQYFGKFKKYIIMYPTVKQYKSGMNLNVKPIPFMDSNDNIQIINSIARENDVLILVKPHFAQIKNFATKNLSNIKFISDSFFEDNEIGSYELMGACDAMLTDYSSVFYDFLICDKPIGFIWEDFEEFSKNPGLVPYYNELTRCGHKIYSLKDLEDFIDAVCKNSDSLKSERNIVCKLANKTNKGDNTSRVVNFILGQLSN